MSLMELANWALVIGVPALLAYQYKLSSQLRDAEKESAQVLAMFVPRVEIDSRLAGIRTEIKQDLALQETRIDRQFAEHRIWTEAQFKQVLSHIDRLYASSSKND